MNKNVLNTDLSGKVAVVTGAGGVLCSYFAKVLARAGAKVALLDLNEEAAKAFAKEIPDTTKIIIAQRISSVEQADKIIVLDGGKIESVGNHVELMEKSPIYREIYESQKKGAQNDEE